MTKYSMGVIASGAIAAACVGLHLLRASGAGPTVPAPPSSHIQATAREAADDLADKVSAPASPGAARARVEPAPSDRPLWFPRAAEQRQLAGDPQLRSRPCLCQFGVGLHVELPGLKIGQLVAPGHYGHHSYGGPSLTEQDGQVYTCGAGFIDTTHLRAAVDWTGHLVVLLDDLTRKGGEADFGPEGGGVHLVIRRSKNPLVAEDILRLAQRIAYERLTWHEVMSWYYHAPVRTFSEQQSTFSPEDAPSNFLGTEIGRRAIARIEADGVAFEDAVDEAMSETLLALGEATSALQTRQAFAQVDRHQAGAPPALSWFDSDVLFWDHRYLFKRNIHVLETVTPWRLPESPAVACEPVTREFVGRVPRTTVSGRPLRDLYEWQFTPERAYFRIDKGEDRTAKDDARFAHTPLPALVTNRDLPAAVRVVEHELRAALGAGFDRPWERRRPPE